MSLNRDDAQHCVTLSRRLLALAKDNAWKEFESTLAERDRLLRPLLEQQFDVTEAADLRAWILEIKALDQQTQRLATQARVQALQAIKQDNKGKKMQAAYGKTKRPY